MIKKDKALALISGGLDSIIAARLILEQGIDCTGVYFSSPLWSNPEKENNFIKKVSEENNLKIIIKNVGEDYIEMIKTPKHGHGKNINPCLDCKIYMLKKAKEIMEEINADFIVTGEVLGQRPMSQHRAAFNLIEKETGLQGKILRPLSAKILPDTSIDNLIDKDKLADIHGRSRKAQYKLADELKLKNFGSPAGGCLLTEKKYAKKLSDLFKHKEKVTIEDLKLLNIGRHFRFNNIKIVVGRNKEENEKIITFKTTNDYIIDTPNYGSPVTLLQSCNDPEIITFACQVTAFYSDCKLDEVIVKYQKDEKEEFLKVKQLPKDFIDKFNITLN